VIIKRTKQKSSRYLRVAEIIKKAVSEVLLRNELPLNPNFQFPLSVVSIEMSPDLRIAYVYVNTLENLEKDEIINRLESCRRYLSKEVNQLISLKFAPKLIYRYDLTTEKYDQILKLLETKKVKSDLNHDED
jgi:ribosome-binding factor A